jgi:hypothetical protein
MTQTKAGSAGTPAHTPGPWTATDPHQWLADTPRFKSSIRYGSTKLGNSIAEVYLGGPGGLKCDAESVNANARLIAAAPDLLEALERLVKEHESTRYSSLEKRMADWQVAREAIQKARGERV